MKIKHNYKYQVLVGLRFEFNWQAVYLT